MIQWCCFKPRNFLFFESLVLAKNKVIKNCMKAFMTLMLSCSKDCFCCVWILLCKWQMSFRYTIRTLQTKFYNITTTDRYFFAFRTKLNLTIMYEIWQKMMLPYLLTNYILQKCIQQIHNDSPSLELEVMTKSWEDISNDTNCYNSLC